MRARFREQVREDVKAAALRQIAAGGACAVSINAIARELGVSGPGLYRYFANRDDLLEDLVLDAYHDLADALAAATDRELGQSPQDRFRALFQAWRSFALAEPHRYRLLYAPPVPGYEAHAEQFVRASSSVMDVGLDVFADLAASSERPASGVRASSPETGLSAVAGFPQERLATTAGPEELLRVISAWTWCHGFVGLEIGGNFSSMGLDADAMFRHEVDALIRDYDSARDLS
jgi:AcrR family transcriptional regulator